MEQTAKIIQQTPTENLAPLVTQLLPNLDQWYNALGPFLATEPNPALAMTNSLGGTLYLINPSQSGQGDDQSVNYDLEGYALPTRIISFAMNILRLGPMLETMGEDIKSAVLEMLSIFAELVTDSLSVASHPSLWNGELEIENEMTSLLADSQLVLSTNLKSLPYIDQQLLHRAEGMSVISYYNARAYATLMAQSTEINPGAIGAEQQQALVSRLEGRKLTFNAVALMARGMDFKLALRLCNGYIDTIAEIDLDTESVEGRFFLMHSLISPTN